jgi:putative ABC transport system permease protein
VQFAVATFLLAAVLIVHLQNSQLLETGLGLSSEVLLVIENDTDTTGLQQATLQQELLQLPGVLDAAGLSVAPWGDFWTVPLGRSPDAAEPPRPVVAYIVGAGFYETVDMTLLAGRFLDIERAEDNLRFDPNRPEQVRNIVADRTMIEGLGFATLEDAVDELVYIPSTLTAGFGLDVALPHRIDGIVETRPLIITSHGLRGGIYSYGSGLTLQAVKLGGDGISATVDRIDALWRRLVPSIAISRRFVDDYFNESYENFTRISRVFTALTIFALTIATVGLFAMAMLIARARTKEVAIRKVLGVTRGRACAMLLFNFLVPALVGGIIALPLAYYAAANYLEVFIDPIELTLYPFIMCLFLAAIISSITVAAFAWRTASVSPATVLHRA